MTMFQTSTLFETNKCHHVGPLMPRAQGNCSCCFSLNLALGVGYLALALL